MSCCTDRRVRSALAACIRAHDEPNDKAFRVFLSDNEFWGQLKSANRIVPVLRPPSSPDLRFERLRTTSTDPVVTEPHRLR